VGTGEISVGDAVVVTAWRDAGTEPMPA